MVTLAAVQPARMALHMAKQPKDHPLIVWLTQERGDRSWNGFADDINVARSTINRIVNGNTAIDVKTAIAIGEGLGVDPNAVLHRAWPQLRPDEVTPLDVQAAAHSDAASAALDDAIAALTRSRRSLRRRRS